MNTLTKILTVISLLISSCAVLNNDKYTHRQEVLTETKLVQKLSYFRVMKYRGSKFYEMDFDGDIYIHTAWMVLKGATVIDSDTRFNFDQKLNSSEDKHVWRGHLYGYDLDPVQVIVEYVPEEYVILFFPKQNITLHFKTTRLKGESKPLPEYGVWIKSQIK